MTSDSQDDDRTVIRPQGLANFTTPVTTAAATPPSPPEPTRTPDDEHDKTLLMAAAPAAPPPMAPLPAAPPPAAPLPAPALHDMGNGLPVGTHLAEFELTALLGEGGFGIVYLALDHSLGRRVALKEYMPSVLAARTATSQVQVKSERHRDTFEAGRKSFVNEARLLASFDHPSLVKVYRFWEANGTAYMVMPFYEGKTLKDTLREMGHAPDEAWLRRLLGPLTEALAVVHGEQCYHRDIAPDNVMMQAGSGQPLLLDFGAARRVIGDMTQALTVILKPGYAPVEQYAEIPGMKQGPWTDVYALAAVVYFAIVGKTPPPSVGRLLNDTYVPLAEQAVGRYDPGFLAAIDRALVVRPEQRTQTVAQLRAELGLGGGAVAAPMPPSSPTAAVASAPPGTRAGASPTGLPSPSTPQDGARKSSPLVVVGGAMLLLAVAVGAYMALSPPSRPAAGAMAGSASPAPILTPPLPSAPVGAGATVAVALPANLASAPASTQAVARPNVSGRFDVGAEFDKVVAAQTPGFELDARPGKSVLRIGRDELTFNVQAERDGYLYVLVFGADGALTLLYPNTTSGALKVRKGHALKLPQAPVFFETSEPAGPTLLLVMVSNRQRDYGALQPRKDGPYRLLPTGAAAQRLATAHTGPRPLLAGSPICPSAAACDDEFGAALIKVDTVR